MVILIGGASHTGKTNFAQQLLEKYKYPYLSIDHLKMGLIRSGNTELTPISDDLELTKYLWPIVREVMKTAIENGQNLIIEGYYIPFDWQADFDESYLHQIRYICLIMSERYIRIHFEDIKNSLIFASIKRTFKKRFLFVIRSFIVSYQKVMTNCKKTVGKKGTMLAVF